MMCESTGVGLAALVAAVTLTAAMDARAGQLSCAVSGTGDELLVRVSGAGAELTRSAPPGPWKADALRCEPYGEKAARVVLPGDGSLDWEMFVGVDPAGALVVAWEGLTGLAGDYGERWGWFIDLEPVKPGGDEKVVILYALSELVKMCGHGMVPLWVRMYDPASASFRPIGFDRLRRSTEGWGHGAAPSPSSTSTTKTTIVTSVATGSDPGGPPALQGFLRFRSASTTLGDNADPTLLRAPLELGDGNPATGWLEGVGGNGWGEFVTASTANASIPITSLVLHLTRGQDKKESKKLNRIKELEIVTSDDERFLARIPVDPAKHPETPVIVRFPAPVATECVTLIIRDVYPAKKESGDHTYIGEVTAYTSLDSGEGILDLMKWFSDPERGAAAAGLVKDLGPAAVDAVAQAWSQLEPEARLGVLGAIDAAWSPSLPALAGAASTLAHEQERTQEFALLVDGLLAVLLEDETDLETVLSGWIDGQQGPAMTHLATAVLGRAGRPGALALLIAEMMPGAEADWSPFDGVGLASWIRDGLARGGTGGLASVESALGTLDPAIQDEVRIALTLLYLLDYDKGGAPVRDLASAWAARLWNEAPTLYCRHHLLPVAGKLIALGDARGVALAALAVEEVPADPPLVVEALLVLGNAPGALVPDAASLALGALDDPHPGVRAEAATCLRRLGATDEAVREAALASAAGDLWPEVRLSAIRLVATFEDIPMQSMYSFLVDPDSNVRKEAVRLAVARGFATKEIGILLANTTVDAAMRGDVRAEAAHAIGSLCIVEMAMPLGNVLYYGIVPGASEAQIQAAAAAADALGRLGDPGPIDKIILATRPGLRLQIRIAAIRALGLIADPEAIDPLEELSKSPDGTIAAAAREALALVEAGTSTSACSAAN